MRVMLINPPIDSVLEDGHASPVTAFLFYNSAPLGILYIAAVLEQAGHEVAAVDAAAELMDVDATVQRVRDFQPDVIGIGSFTVTFETTQRLGEKLKQAMPDVPLVLGSYHVTLETEEAMSFPSFDVGVIGEGEFTMLELVQHYEGRRTLDSVDGIIYRTDRFDLSLAQQGQPQPAGAFHYTRPRARFTDLDALPFPARHLLPPNIYRPVPVDEHAFPKFALMTSRGCPHSCAFCQKSRSGYRSHSPKYIVDEMEHVVRDFGVRDIAFVDSLFCASKKRVYDVCDEIMRRGMHKKVSWTCSSRVEIVDKPLLQRMKDAGCWRTRFGIESGNDRVLDFISKGITKEKIRDAITAADEVGLRPKAFFMVGHMPDTRDSIIETIEFAKSLPLHDITVQINTLLPQTPQMDIWKREGARWGRVVNQTNSEKSFWEPTFVPWGLEPEDIIELHRRFYREFYFRPVTIKRYLDSIHSWRDVAKYVQAAQLFAFLFFDKDIPSFKDWLARGREATA